LQLLKKRATEEIIYTKLPNSNMVDKLYIFSSHQSILASFLLGMALIVEDGGGACKVFRFLIPDLCDNGWG